MTRVKVLERKRGFIADKSGLFASLIFWRFVRNPHNALCISILLLNAQNSRISHQRFCSALSWQYWASEMQILSGRALTKTFIHIPFVGTPYGFMISFSEWALRERCSRHPSSKRYHEWCWSITVPTKEKNIKNTNGCVHHPNFEFVGYAINANVGGTACSRTTQSI